MRTREWLLKDSVVEAACGNSPIRALGTVLKTKGRLPRKAGS
jgi:hypothetical protein